MPEKSGGRHRDPEGRRANKNSEPEILGVPLSKKKAAEDAGDRLSVLKRGKKDRET